jgi:uncharacterized membrane protein YfcA
MLIGAAVLVALASWVATVEPAAAGSALGAFLSPRAVSTADQADLRGVLVALSCLAVVAVFTSRRYA